MKRLKVIACEVAVGELCLCASHSNNIIDFTFMPRKLHVVGADKMRETLQSELDKVDSNKYDGIVLAYGLCGYGLVGLKSQLPIIIPKVHDCISFFMGSEQRYADFKKTYPKSFFFTSGWLEREIMPSDNKAPNDYTLYKSMIDHTIFINTGVGHVEQYRKDIKEIAQNLEASYMEIASDQSMLAKLLNGEWDENNFVVIPPNHCIIATNDENVMGYEIYIESNK